MPEGYNPTAQVAPFVQTAIVFAPPAVNVMPIIIPQNFPSHLSRILSQNLFDSRLR